MGPLYVAAKGELKLNECGKKLYMGQKTPCAVLAL
jgi:hypothetical protein